MTTESVMEAGSGGIHGQMMTVLSLYQVLTNLYFLAIEQGASTSNASTRAMVNTQLTQVYQLTQSGMEQLPITHQNKLAQATEPFRAQDVHLSSSSNPLIMPSSAHIAHSIQVMDDILADLVTRARRHARNQIRIQDLVTTIQRKEDDLKSTIKKLSLLSDKCNRLVRYAKEEVESMDQAEKRE
jgi:hypothetical protein